MNRRLTQAEHQEGVMILDQHHVDTDVARIYRLTPRQVEILTRVAAGQTNGRIGRALYVTEDAVKKQLKRVFERLQVADRAAAVAVAYDVGVFRTRAERLALATSLRGAA